MACVPLYGLCGGVCVCGLRRLVSLVNVRSAVYTLHCLPACVRGHSCVCRACWSSDDWCLDRRGNWSLRCRAVVGDDFVGSYQQTGATHM